MSLPYQWDRRLYARTQHYGCELLATMAIPQDYHRDYLLTFDYEVIIQEIINRGAFDPTDGSVATPEAPYLIGKAVSEWLGHREMVLQQVGSIERGIVRFWGWVKNPWFNYAIKRGFLHAGSRHSKLLNGRFEEIYDPLRFTECAEVTGIYLYAYGSRKKLSEIAGQTAQTE